MNNIFKKIYKNRLCYYFIAPFLMLFFVFNVMPILISIYYSFTYYNILEPAKFVGFNNYAKLMFSDEIFLKSFINTITMALMVGPGGYILAILLAWVINDLKPKVRAVLVLMIYAPAISGNAYMIWKIIFSGDAYGYINGFLLNLGIVDTPIQFFNDSKYMMGVIILIVLWSSMGTGFLAFVAGLQGVDKSLYEAGAIDGIKHKWQELWNITLPSMKPQLLFGAIISITSSFAISDVTINLCGSPSTDYAVNTVLNHLVDYGSNRFEMGYSCAIATLLFLIMIGCNLLIQKLLKNIGS